ncbi:MAG: Hsp70 family protein [Geobacteraceae bacterium]|nr:Hsp70 family protein [Geobacteraceae bacterium]
MACFSETGDVDHFSPSISRNTRIPAKKSEMYYTSYPKQEKAVIEVFQGENHSCRRNNLIGSFAFDLKHSPEDSLIIVEPSYDRDGNHPCGCGTEGLC